VEPFLDQYGYLALMVGTFFEGETAILIASSLIHRGLFEGPYTVIFGFAGWFISDGLYFIIGRLNGKYFLAKRPALLAKVAPVQRFFEKNQLQILLSYRFLYGFRIIIPVVVGMSHIRLSQYLFYSVVSGLIWATTVSTVGYFIGRFLNIETSAFEENVLLIVLFFATFGMIVGYLLKRFAFGKLTS